MACINMFNPDHQGLCGSMSPRISFSNDFAADSVAGPAKQSSAPPDPNFEFAVGGRPMMAADELFFKGRMLPLRGPRGGGAAARSAATTIRDELRSPEDATWDSSRGAHKGPRWRELLGLKKPHCSKKSDEPAKHTEELRGDLA